MNKFLLRHGYIIAFLSCFVAGALVGSFYESRRTLDVIDHCKEKVEKSNKAIIAYHKGYTTSKQNLNKALKLLREVKELLIRKEKELQDLKLENHKLKNFT
jgi:cell shape-determining protein MreC